MTTSRTERGIEYSDARNTSLDILRIILAILIVYIHFSGALYIRGKLKTWGLAIDDIILILARVAVPTFFAISGYCLFRGSQSSENRSIGRSMRKLTMIMLGAIFLYAIVGLILHGPSKLTSTFTPYNFFGAALFNQTSIFFNAYTLWFIPALITCYGIYYLYPRFFKNKKYLIILAALFYTYSITIGEGYSGILADKGSKLVYTSFIGLGLPFFTLGYFFHKNQESILRTLKSPIKWFLLAFSLYIIEQIIYLSAGHYRKPLETTVMMPFLVSTILLMAASYPSIMNNTPLPKVAAKYSLYLYIGHLAIINILNKIIYNDRQIGSVRYYKVLIMYAAVVGITLMCSFAYAKAKNYATRYTEHTRLS